MNVLIRAWAMRTSRESEAHRTYIRSELNKGVLRQGWGWLPEQDLRSIKVRKASGPLSEEQRAAWPHWRMMGSPSGAGVHAMLDGDLVLIPNMPHEGFFTICALRGDYDYDIDPRVGDFGHKRPVEVLTPGGVANTHALVSADLRSSLRCRSRLWDIDAHADSLSAILAQAASGEGALAGLRQGSDHARRARAVAAGSISLGLDGMARSIETALRTSLRAEEWEPVIADALTPLMRDVRVIHTGGPAEKGADIEIHIPNPFAPADPWTIVLQVKDYRGDVGVEVASQLVRRQVI